MARNRSWSVAGRVFGVQVVAVTAIGALLLVVLALDARRAADDAAATTSLAVSQTIAVDPAVHSALLSADPTAELQPYALAVMKSAHVDFVTIMDAEGIRFTHPDTAQIGKPFLGTIAAAQRGETITETYTGTLGPSVRAVVPVVSEGEVIGIVSAGVTAENVLSALLPRIPFVIGLAVLVVVLGGVAAALTRRSLGRMTGGLGPVQLQRMVQFYESVLHSVREGVVITDPQHRVVLYNDEAADLLGLPPVASTMQPLPARELGIDASVASLLDSGRRVVEESHVADGRVLLVNQEPATAPGMSDKGADGRSRSASAVMTIRDQSELQSLVGELESVRTLSESLHSQAHEHANTLHTIVALLEMGRSDEVRALVADASRTSQGLADAVLDPAADPVLSALLLGKSATASERGIEFAIEIEDALRLPLSTSETLSVVGNLVDNALDAARDGELPRRVSVRLLRDAGDVVIEVVDSGTGPRVVGDPFALGVTSKPDDGNAHGVGLSLVKRIVEAHAGSVAFREGLPTTVVATFPREAGA